MEQAYREDTTADTVRSILGILFAVLVVLFEIGGQLTSLVLGVLFGFYALLDGISALYELVRVREAGGHWWAPLFEAIAGILAGFLVLTSTATILFPELIAVMAIWALVVGIFRIVLALDLKENSERWLMTSGIITLLLGLFFLVFPEFTLSYLAWAVSIPILVATAIMFNLPLDLRKPRVMPRM